ncbi:hypothetical protein NGRA_0928 [Nosema granulosis]|uniref:5'-3' DNA helicase ZGRF1-like N-terminal domain-containing protein n=1 Tax=Nosema granulosis TaxID=83296 RepID=A0A9P6H2N7_9MICR|nr:hypothetical protein NGRA_0928 [Nosema granulosis]
MLPCVYTKDKKKKLKTWFDGFVRLDKNKMKLFDDEKKMVDSKTMNKLSNDIETMRHIIYIENLEEVENLENQQEILPHSTENKDEEPSRTVGRSNEEIIKLFKCTK